MEATTSERYASGGPSRELYAQNLALAFEATAERLGDDPAIIAGEGDDETRITWTELRERVHRIAGGLASLGVGKSDTVAIMLNNRPEFIPIDMAAVSLGAVPFSIYQTSSPEQIEYVVSDAGAKLAIIERAFLDVFNRAREQLPQIETLIVIDGDEGDHTLADLERMDPEFDATDSLNTVQPDDLLTLIYTSGTTGPPKGVQLTHRNLMTLTAGVEDIVDFPDRGAKVISWLPAAHIAERGAHYYLPVIRGCTVTICPNPRDIIAFLPKVRPTWFFAVPRIWEKLKAGLEANLANLPGEQGVAAKAGLEAALTKLRLDQAGEEVPEELAAAVAKADEEMFAGLRKMLGLDEVVAVNVGAAPTPLEVLEFFHSIGIPIGELWGMSETCGTATVNPPEKIKLGTVGPPVPGVEIKLADDGEVLVKGDLIMAGYRNMPEKTAEAIDEDGWLATGDIGELDSDGYLKIVDRKKELIINAAGKNMSPANIESKLKAASPLIGQAIAIGDARPYNVALIVLDPDFVPVWAKQNGYEGVPLAELAGEAELIAAIQEGVDEANAKMSRVEQIKKFTVLPSDWMPGGDELTPTMKLKRKPIGEKYSDEIDAPEPVRGRIGIRVVSDVGGRDVEGVVSERHLRLERRLTRLQGVVVDPALEGRVRLRRREAEADLAVRRAVVRLLGDRRLRPGHIGAAAALGLGRGDRVGPGRRRGEREVGGARAAVVAALEQRRAAGGDRAGDRHRIGDRRRRHPDRQHQGVVEPAPGDAVDVARVPADRTPGRVDVASHGGVGQVGAGDERVADQDRPLVVTLGDAAREGEGARLGAERVVGHEAVGSDEVLARGVHLQLDEGVVVGLGGAARVDLAHLHQVEAGLGGRRGQRQRAD
jgi:long-chain acyl-CoA synthetase